MFELRSRSLNLPRASISARVGGCKQALLAVGIASDCLCKCALEQLPEHSLIDIAQSRDVQTGFTGLMLAELGQQIGPTLGIASTQIDRVLCGVRGEAKQWCDTAVAALVAILLLAKADDPARPHHRLCPRNLTVEFE